MEAHEILGTLRPETREWVENILDEIDMGAHEVRLVLLAAQSWDESQMARQVLATEGMTYLDRWECPRARPEVMIERDARAAYARLIRMLRLDPPEEEPDGLPLVGKNGSHSGKQR